MPAPRRLYTEHSVPSQNGLQGRISRPPKGPKAHSHKAQQRYASRVIQHSNFGAANVRWGMAQSHHNNHQHAPRDYEHPNFRAAHLQWDNFEPLRGRMAQSHEDGYPQTTKYHEQLNSNVVTVRWSRIDIRWHNIPYDKFVRKVPALQGNLQQCGRESNTQLHVVDLGSAIKTGLTETSVDAFVDWIKDEYDPKSSKRPPEQSLCDQLRLIALARELDIKGLHRCVYDHVFETLRNGKDFAHLFAAAGEDIMMQSAMYPSTLWELFIDKCWAHSTEIMRDEACLAVMEANLQFKLRLYDAMVDPHMVYDTWMRDA